MKPSWTNFHSHTFYDDGKSPLEDYITAAIEQNVKSYGFSTHSPVPFPSTWNMKMEKYREYLAEIERLKEKYKDQIQIYAGLEVDYIEGKCGVHNFRELDYSVGSVHYVNQFEDGNYWEIDYTKTHYDKGLQEIFGGSIKRAFQRYVDLNIKMIEEDTPTVLGHLDKMKMHNSTGKWFEESEEWYQELIEKYLEVIKAKNIIVEVNTRGFYKGYSQLYPSPWILEKVLEKNIPITLSSDAHTTAEITKGFAETALQLKEIGFKTMHVLWDGEWQPFPFDEKGVYLP
ncbi:histidinol-phosphatase [Flammeovirga sp. SJP92]|uniref:histidinol-phosphatase n=1 Tax=Flammeovirga sp. SJP92 TaxID=1775430 RepID=UPI000786D61B|nr:histidinol-phosphatase [Flammeovirga sp. SJP92]KXX71861.1 hypothetical protein AVL50_03495 [Flammeovirga sp. SJP92]